MKRISLFSGAFALFFVLGCSGILGTPLEQVEGSYSRRMETFVENKDKLATLEEQVKWEKRINDLEQRYAKLSTDETTRVDELGDLNKDLRKVSRELDDELEQAGEKAEIAAAIEAEKNKSTLIGTWTGGDRSLTISPTYDVVYVNNSGAMKKEITAPMQSYDGDTFKVGALGINTTFVVNQPPAQGEDGRWSMVVDDVPMLRQ